jgi:hypothetical protein
VTRHYIVYKTICKIDGKFYIGQHITKDLDDGYLGSGKRLWNAIRKHGPDNFVREILFNFETFEEMNEKEKELVTEDLVKNPQCYNIALGGTGSWWHVNQVVNHLPAQKLGGFGVHEKFWNKISKEEKHKIYKKINMKIAKSRTLNGTNNFWEGKNFSEEHKGKIGKANSISQLGSRNSQFGKRGSVWMYSEELDQMKKIKKEEAPPFLEKGWRYGKRKQKG